MASSRWFFSVSSSAWRTHAIRQTALQSSPPPLVGFFPGLIFLPQLAVIFLRLGAGTFGGGLAMVPTLEPGLVETLGWLSPREFTDAVTLGQITPGPIVITSTVVWYRIAGIRVDTAIAAVSLIALLLLHAPTVLVLALAAGLRLGALWL